MDLRFSKYAYDPGPIMRYLTSLVLFALLAVAPGQIQAQTAASDVTTELRTLVSEHETEAGADRAAIADFLDRDEVAQAARTGGIDLDRVRAAVPALGADDAEKVAERVQDVEQQLAGGDTFVISTTTIIIALLVVILIVVA